VLALEAVLPTGEIIRRLEDGKSVVGYDLTQLLIGSEGTLAIITEVVLRLVPDPPAQRALRAAFSASACGRCGRAAHSAAGGAGRDRTGGSDSLEALRAHLGRRWRRPAPGRR
jgi:FAD/FMN-containing dehydrogenase